MTETDAVREAAAGPGGPHRRTAAATQGPRARDGRHLQRRGRGVVELAVPGRLEAVSSVWGAVFRGLKNRRASGRKARRAGPGAHSGPGARDAHSAARVLLPRPGVRDTSPVEIVPDSPRRAASGEHRRRRPSRNRTSLVSASGFVLPRRTVTGTPSPAAASATSAQRRALTSLRRIPAMKNSPAITALSWPRFRATSPGGLEASFDPEIVAGPAGRFLVCPLLAASRVGLSQRSAGGTWPGAVACTWSISRGLFRMAWSVSVSTLGNSWVGTWPR